MAVDAAAIVGKVMVAEASMRFLFLENFTAIRVRSSASILPFTGDQITKLLNLVGDKNVCDGVGVNMADIADLGFRVNNPNGIHANIKMIGNLKLTDDITLFDVLVVPALSMNLLSVRKLAKDSKCVVGFDACKCYIQDLSLKKFFGIGNKQEGLLGHHVEPVFNSLKHRLALGDDESFLSCDVCNETKQACELFASSENSYVCLGEVVHMDVLGPLKVVIIVDEFSKAVWVYMLKSKSEVVYCVHDFINLLQNQFDKSVKVFRTVDCAEARDIVRQAYTPQHNNEPSKYCTITSCSKWCSIGYVPMWSECMKTATYLINRISSSSLCGKCPYELVYGFEPVVSHLRCFGCLCYTTKLDKFVSTSERCAFLGYSVAKTGYRLCSFDSKRIIFSRNVKFYEDVFPFKLGASSVSDGVNIDNVSHLNFFALRSSINGNTKFVYDNLDGSQKNNKGREVSSSSVRIIGTNSLSKTWPVDDFSKGFPLGIQGGTVLIAVLKMFKRVSNLSKLFDDFIGEGKEKYDLQRVIY
ncbi:hypothetical protein OSB04_008597 [Centaurea solstitialis]|uniref:Retroviral polymerase SH3-like domain-containing protein n=1 Tax=Centaurea solstitialis TaxID=347529 RepID=A0AA38WJN9_9ASTR|nr:hypothetical protein OSB04_008597 [Centaurea solstitialis]